MPLEQRDEARLEVPVEAADRRVHLAAAQLARGPEGVVPEVARELVERNVVRQGGRRRSEHRRELCLHPELVVEHAVSPRQQQPAPRESPRALATPTRRAAGSRRPRQSRTGRGARRAMPKPVASRNFSIGVPNSATQLASSASRRGSSRKSTRRGPTSGRRARRHAPVSRRRARRARPPALAPSPRSPPRRGPCACSRSAGASRRPRARSGSRREGTAPRGRLAPRARGRAPWRRRPECGPVWGTARSFASSCRSSGVTSGQSTGSTQQTSFDAARTPVSTPKTGARSSASSCSTGNGSSSASASFPTAMTSSNASFRTRHARSPSVSPRKGASAFGEPNRSDAPPTRRIPVAVRRPAKAPSRRSSVPRARSRRA